MSVSIFCVFSLFRSSPWVPSSQRRRESKVNRTARAVASRASLPTTPRKTIKVTGWSCLHISVWAVCGFLGAEIAITSYKDLTQLRSVFVLRLFMDIFRIASALIRSLNLISKVFGLTTITTCALVSSRPARRRRVAIPTCDVWYRSWMRCCQHRLLICASHCHPMHVLLSFSFSAMHAFCERTSPARVRYH